MYSLMQMKETAYIYMLMNKINTVIYIGVTTDLIKRVYEHKNKFVEGFTNKYNVNKLVYYECCDSIQNAIEREKQLKRWHREWKINLIKSINPSFKDLYNTII